MNMLKHKLFRPIAFAAFALALGMPPYGSGQATTRAGLDFRIQVTEHGDTEEVMLDFGSYLFSDGDTYLQPREVNAKGNYVDFLFTKVSDFSFGHPGPEINYNDVLEASEPEFQIDYHQVFRLKEGQTVSLQGQDIRVTLLEVLGVGAPAPHGPSRDGTNTRPVPYSGRPNSQTGGGAPQVWRVPDSKVSLPSSAPESEPIMLPAQRQEDRNPQRYRPTPVPNVSGEPVPVATDATVDGSD